MSIEGRPSQTVPSALSKPALVEAVLNADDTAIVLLLAPYFTNIEINRVPFWEGNTQIDAVTACSLSPAYEDGLREAILLTRPELRHTPLCTNLAVRQFDALVVPTLYHLAESLIGELQATIIRHPALDISHTVETLLSRQLGLEDWLRSQSEKDEIRNHKEELTKKEYEKNRTYFDALDTLLVRQFPHSFSARRLHQLQTLLWQVITTNRMHLIGDLHYRSNFNASDSRPLPTLFPFSNSPLHHILNRKGNLFHFVEDASVSGCNIAGFSTMFGFQNTVHIDPEGGSYITEDPLVMIPSEIMSLDSPLVDEILQFELDFPRTHDVLHHLIPVYSDIFLVNHPTSPISLGKRTAAYETFGKAMRGDTDAYELALGILHRQIIEQMDHSDGATRESHFVLLKSTLQKIAVLKTELISTHGADLAGRVSDYLATLFVTRVLNVYPASSPEFEEVDQLLVQLELPELVVAESQLQQIFAAQGLLDPDAQSSSSYIGFPGLNPDTPTRRTGAEHIVTALEAMGILPFDPQSPPYLSGVNRARFLTIIMPKPELYGYAEKIHAMDRIPFGVSEKPEMVTPLELLVRHAQIIMDEIDIYQDRIMQSEIAQLITHRLYELIFPNPLSKDATIYTIVQNYLKNDVGSETYKITIKFVTLVDQLLYRMLTDTYITLSSQQKQIVRQFVYMLETDNHPNQKGFIQDAAEIRILFDIYSDFCKLMHSGGIQS